MRQRRIKRNIARRANKIFELLKDWRLETSVIEGIENKIRHQIGWFDVMNKRITESAEIFDASITDAQGSFENQKQICKMGRNSL